MKPVRFKISGKEIEARPNLVDQVVNFFSPSSGRRRMADRIAVAAVGGGYTGAKKTRKRTKSWTTSGGDADSDILPDLPSLRDRSRDLIRNEPIATGACGTMVTNVIGTGLRLKPAIDYEYLGLTEDEASQREKEIKREWSLWAHSTYCDVERTQPFNELQALAFRQTFENGDVFALLPKVERKDGFPYQLAVQLIEADRVCNNNSKRDTETLSGGIEKDKNGAPKAYHVLKRHPGATISGYKKEWYPPIPAFGINTGRRNMIHVFRKLRPNQSRGVPELAPIIETLKQLSKLTEAELDAAVGSALITYFIKSTTGEAPDWNQFLQDNNAANRDVSDIDLDSSSVVGLLPDEEVQFNDPNRPNGKFDPFWLSCLRQIGMAIEIPFEVLIKHFSSSYSASRAAMLEAWRMFSGRRKWFAARFNQLIYETFFDEMVALGRFYAPGYFSDVMTRKAWTGSAWIGDPRGMINEKEEIEAASKRIAEGVSTIEEEIEQLTGGDFDDKHRKRAREHQKRLDAGLVESKKDIETIKAALKQSVQSIIEERQNHEAD